jgi:hypothetical protein
MTIKQALKKLKEEGQEVHLSNRKGFDYFVASGLDELPLGVSIADNIDIQAFGTHLTKNDVIIWAKLL